MATIDLTQGRQRTSATSAIVIAVIGVLALIYAFVGSPPAWKTVLLIVIAVVLFAFAWLQGGLVRRQQRGHVMQLDVDSAGLGFTDERTSGTAPVRWQVGWPELTSVAIVRQAWPDAVVGRGSRSAVHVPQMPARGNNPNYSSVAVGTVLLDLVARTPLETTRPELGRFRVGPPQDAPHYRLGLGEQAGLAAQLSEQIGATAGPAFAGQHDESAPAMQAPQPVWNPADLADKLL